MCKFLFLFLNPSCFVCVFGEVNGIVGIEMELVERGKEKNWESRVDFVIGQRWMCGERERKILLEEGKYE